MWIKPSVLPVLLTFAALANGNRLHRRELQTNGMSDSTVDMDVIGNICHCAQKHQVCGDNCLALMDVEDEECRTYGVNGICGGVISTTELYTDFCTTHNFECDATELNTQAPLQTTGLPTMAPVSVISNICHCANKHKVCGDTCMILFDVEDDECRSYGAQGICGGVIGTEEVYSQFCAVNNEPCTEFRVLQEDTREPSMMPSFDPAQQVDDDSKMPSFETQAEKCTEDEFITALNKLVEIDLPVCDVLAQNLGLGQDIEGDVCDCLSHYPMTLIDEVPNCFQDEEDEFTLVEIVAACHVSSTVAPPVSSSTTEPDTVIADMCFCANKHKVCGDTCMILFDVEDDECRTYGAQGICGGIIGTDEVYSQFCDVHNEPCTEFRVIEEDTKEPSMTPSFEPQNNDDDVKKCTEQEFFGALDALAKMNRTTCNQLAEGLSSGQEVNVDVCDCLSHFPMTLIDEVPNCLLDDEDEMTVREVVASCHVSSTVAPPSSTTTEPDTVIADMCFCANKHKVCGDTCMILFDVEDDECRTYGAQGICGGIIGTEEVYSQFCDVHNEPCTEFRVIEEDTKEPSMMPSFEPAQQVDDSTEPTDVIADMCFCANKHKVCGDTCMILFDVEDDECRSYGVNGICGGIIGTEEVYSQFCAAHNEPCTEFRVIEEDTKEPSMTPSSEPQNNDDADMCTEQEFMFAVNKLSEMNLPICDQMVQDLTLGLDVEINVCDCLSHYPMELLNEVPDCFHTEDEMTLREYVASCHVSTTGCTGDELFFGNKLMDDIDLSTCLEETNNNLCACLARIPDDVVETIPDCLPSDMDQFTMRGQVLRCKEETTTTEEATTTTEEAIVETQQPTRMTIDTNHPTMAPIAVIENICQCANKHKVCGDTCMILFDVEDDECRSYGAQGICGGVIGTQEIYSEFCSAHAKPCTEFRLLEETTTTETVIVETTTEEAIVETQQPSMMIDTNQPTMAPIAVIENICHCANKHKVCGDTCMILFNVDDDECRSYGAQGICGGIIGTQEVYAEFCSEHAKPCTEFRFIEETTTTETVIVETTTEVDELEQCKELTEVMEDELNKLRNPVESVVLEQPTKTVTDDSLQTWMFTEVSHRMSTDLPEGHVLTLADFDGFVQYVVQDTVEDKLYATCVFYDSDANAECPEEAQCGATETNGWPNAVAKRLTEAFRRNNFRHEYCTSVRQVCEFWPLWWKETLLEKSDFSLNMLSKERMLEMSENICIAPNNELMYVNKDVIQHTCVGYGAPKEACPMEREFMCTGFSLGQVTYGWPGQILQALTLALNHGEEGTTDYYHPQCGKQQNRFWFETQN